LASSVSASPEEIRYRRKAKIICTIGPACGSEELVRDLLRCGMDVARLNFSHGTHEDHQQRIAMLRRVAAEQGRTICILQDLQGPKIRTGKLEGRKSILLEAGKQITITPQDVAGTPALVSTTFQTLARDVEVGGRILFSDGRIELRVAAIDGTDVICDIINGGKLAEHQGINLPGAVLSVPALTEKDEEDLAFGLQNDVDMVAVSFVRRASDVHYVKNLIREAGRNVPVIAKLEKPQAIEHLEEILEAAAGVMVARGDLGVELPAEKVPVIQKHIIARAAEWRKPVIIATQMLESMIENPRPTRAEASDVANAVFDGTDAVMLSGETASGKYPREAVNMMSRIILEAEASMAENREQRRTRRRRGPDKSSISETICDSIAHAAEDLDMGAIAVFTQSGHTAKLVSKYRPKCPIFAFARSATVCHWMNLLWGVYPMMAGSSNSAESMVVEAESVLLHGGRVRIGEVIGVVAGTQMASGSTDFMRLHVVQAPVKPEFGH
jgi:pyruvate kinase